MKPSLFLLAAAGLFFAGAGSLHAQDLPKPFNFSRYQPMMERSPFAVATAAALPAATANFAKDLFIANAARSPAGDLVTIASSTDKNFKKYLTTKTPEDGYTISGIEWSDRVGETKVTISKEGQFATLSFNQALLSQPIQNPPPQPNQPSQMIQPPSGSNFIRPAPIPTLPTPPARVRGVIPRNPVPTPVPTVADPASEEN